MAVDINDPADGFADLSGTGKKVAIVCDISRPEQIDDVVEAVTERFGRCDILLNNAAIFPYTNLDRVTIEVWQKVQATNVDAVLLFAKGFAPGMKRQAGDASSTPVRASRLARPATSSRT